MNYLGRFWIAISILALLFAWLAPASAQAQLAHWTVLIYLDGDNNLEREAVDDFLEMSAVGSSAEVNIVVQFDRTAGYDRRYGDWTGTLRFHVTQGMNPEPANALADLGETNMGHPQTLADFVSWGMAAFPAQHIALILWNHGDGWQATRVAKEGRKAICWDDTNGRDALDAAELRQTLAAVTDNGATPLDLLAFDACLMAMIEVDAQLRPYVLFRAGSEETEPGTGYPYDTILADLRAHSDWNGAALGTTIVERYYQAYEGETQSAVRLDENYDRLINTVDGLAQVLFDQREAQLEAIQDARRQVQQFQANDVDLNDLARLLVEKTTSIPLREAAQAVMDAIGQVTLANRHGIYQPGAYGISIYFPAQSDQWDDLYAGESNYLAFTAETHWDEFLVAYLQAITVCDPDAYEPDDNPSSAAPIQVNGEPQSHSFCPATDLADWVSFEVGAGQTVEIVTTDLQASCDTAIKLYDDAGTTLLIQDDDGGGDRASKIVWSSPTTMTYRLQIVEYYRRTGQDTGYALHVTALAPVCQPDTYEPDNDPAAAKTVEIDGPAQARNFCPQGDLYDWAAFDAVQGRVYAIESRNTGSEASVALALYGADGVTELSADTTQGPQGMYLQWTCPANGRYFVRAHESAGRTGEYTGYELRISTVPWIISGTVELQGQTSFSGTLLTVQPDGQQMTTLHDGTFAITATLPCTITAVHAGYLSARWTITGDEPDRTTSPTVNLGTVTLLGGDINTDGRIDILDIAFIGARFGSGDAQADINHDGLVDIYDLVLPAGNFGRVA